MLCDGLNWSVQNGLVEFDASSIAPMKKLTSVAHATTGLMSRQTLLRHEYAQSGQLAVASFSHNNPQLGYIRIFYYLTGFAVGDGNLKVVRGSHLFRDATVNCLGDEALRNGWMSGKTHPLTGTSHIYVLNKLLLTCLGSLEQYRNCMLCCCCLFIMNDVAGDPLKIEELACPPGSVVIMWTHAVHGVSARKQDSSTRVAIATSYRNPVSARTHPAPTQQGEP